MEDVVFLLTISACAIAHRDSASLFDCLLILDLNVTSDSRNCVHFAPIISGQTVPFSVEELPHGLPKHLVARPVVLLPSKFVEVDVGDVAVLFLLGSDEEHASDLGISVQPLVF